MQKELQDKNDSNEITIDDLARMVAQGFSSMEERLDERIGNLEQKMDKGFTEINERFDRIEDHHGRRIDTLESRTITLKSHMENGFKKKFAW